MRASRPSRVSPALLTSTSMSPASSTSRRASSGSDTSACTARPHAAAHQSARSLPEAYRTSELIDEQRATPLPRREACGDRGHERRHGLLELDLVDRGTQTIGGARDERGMERAGDLQLDRAA